MQTDWCWRIPAIRLADAHATTGLATTYMYEFAWRSPQDEPAEPGEPRDALPIPKSA